MCPRPVLSVSNPNGPPLPFSRHGPIPGRPRTRPVSNPNGPPLPFSHDITYGNPRFYQTFQTRTGRPCHLASASSHCVTVRHGVVSNPNGPPLPFSRQMVFGINGND